jgi:hypothetical protein
MRVQRHSPNSGARRVDLRIEHHTMPIVDGELLTPAQAMTAGRCPECGEPLAGKDLRGHRESHYPYDIPQSPRYNEVRKRARMFDEYIKSHESPAK